MISYIIDRKGNEVNWSWEKIGFNLLNWLKIEFSEGDQIQVFVEPASHFSKPAPPPRVSLYFSSS